MPAPPAPAPPAAPGPPPAPGVPPAPSQVRAGGYDAAGFVVSDPSWGAAPPGTGSFDQPGASGRRGLGTKLLFVALALAGLIAVGVATGHVSFFFSGSSGRSAPSPSIPQLGAAANGRFDGSGITFRFPQSWGLRPEIRVESTGGQASRSIVIGQDAGAYVIVETFPLSNAEASKTAPQLRAELTALVASMARQSGGVVTLPVASEDMGNLTGYVASLNGVASDGVHFRATLHFGFRGHTEYFVNCQTTDTEQGRIDSGCSQIVRTFHVGSASA